MHTITVREARKTLHHLIDNVAESNAPVIITSHRHNAVLLSSKDWEAVQEAFIYSHYQACKAPLLRD